MDTAKRERSPTESPEEPEAPAVRPGQALSRSGLGRTKQANHREKYLPRDATVRRPVDVRRVDEDGGELDIKDMSVDALRSLKKVHSQVFSAVLEAQASFGLAELFGGTWWYLRNKPTCEALYHSPQTTW